MAQTARPLRRPPLALVTHSRRWPYCRSRRAHCSRRRGRALHRGRDRTGLRPAAAGGRAMATAAARSPSPPAAMPIARCNRPARLLSRRRARRGGFRRPHLRGQGRAGVARARGRGLGPGVREHAGGRFQRCGHPLEKGDLTVAQSWFRDSQQGILTADDSTGRIVVDRSTFTRLGACEAPAAAHIRSTSESTASCA